MVNIKLHGVFENFIKTEWNLNVCTILEVFEAIEANREAEEEYVKSISSKTGPKPSAQQERAFMHSAPLHPAAALKIRNNDINGALKVIMFTSSSSFQRNLARRLSELKLNTSIGENTVEKLANDYLVPTYDLLMKMGGMAQDLLGVPNYKSDLDTMFDEQPKNEGLYKSIISETDSLRAVLKQNNITSGAIFDVIKDLEDMVDGVNDSYTSAGVYFPVSDSISMNSSIRSEEHTSELQSH